MSGEIAKEILRQLGGNKFIAMIGAKNLLSHEDGLSWRMPSGFAKDKINYVKVTLNGMDLYDITFGYIRGLNYKIVRELNDVFVEDLIPSVERETGLHLRLF